MPSAETRARAASTSTTSLKRERSTRGRDCRSRSRNRLDVLFARPIPPGPPALSPRAGARASPRIRSPVQERAAHRVVVADVALAPHDREEARLAVRRPEHLRAGPEIAAPDPPELLVEPFRVELVHPVPVAVEALAPAG